MDEGYASQSGAFQLRGCATDAFNSKIDPILKVYHKCKQRGVTRIVTFHVPKSFIDKEYNMSQTIDLSGTFAAEDETFRSPIPDCTLTNLFTSTASP
uniref:Uncharacterized protein n=1 Tax=Romanomermis culicivorax TaxID=13658 RepID=A0A915IJD6_ROMCU